MRVADSFRPSEFPLLDSLKAKGATDYLALVVDIGRHASLSSARDIAFSWAVDSPNGFTDAEIEVIERLTPTLMLVVNAARNVATGRVLLGTYLGTDAAERMLSGNVVRGEAEPIRAAIWFSDLADFMRISDGAPQRPNGRRYQTSRRRDSASSSWAFAKATSRPRPTARISSRSNLADRAKA